MPTDELENTINLSFNFLTYSDVMSLYLRGEKNIYFYTRFNHYLNNYGVSYEYERIFNNDFLINCNIENFYNKGLKSFRLVEVDPSKDYLNSLTYFDLNNPSNIIFLSSEHDYDGITFFMFTPSYYLVFFSKIDTIIGMYNKQIFPTGSFDSYYLFYNKLYNTQWGYERTITLN